MWVAFALQKLLTFFSKHFQHICVSLNVNFNESLTNAVVSFEQLGPECLAAGPIILQDNAVAYFFGGGDVTTRALQIGNVSHSPYSPDLSPSDFNLVPRLKENMQGCIFEDIEEQEDVVTEQVRMYERVWLATGIQKLPSRLRSVTEQKGHYFKGF